MKNETINSKTKIPWLYNLYFLLVNGKTFRKNLEKYLCNYPLSLNLSQRTTKQTEDKERITNLALTKFPFYGEFLEDQYQHNKKYLTKSFYRDNASFFKEKGVWRKVIETSGSTGVPLRIIRSPIAFINSQISFYNFFLQFNINRFDKNIYIGGARIQSRNRILKKIKDLIIYRIFKQKKFVSVDLIKDEDLKFFLAFYEKFRPVYLQGFSSALIRIAQYIEENNYQLNWKPQLIHPNAEALSSSQRNFLKEIFGAPVAMVYGATECHMASECPFGKMHLNMENCDLQETEGGSAILTVLGTDRMPIINYRIGDLIKISDSDEICECGKDTVVLEEVIGREQDVIELKSGYKISHPDINMLISQIDQANQIYEYQVVHNIVSDDIEIRTLCSKSFNSDNFIQSLNDRFNDINFIYSNEPFILLKNGKKPVIARIGLNPETRKTFFSYEPYAEISDSQEHQSSQIKKILKLDWNESTLDFPEALKKEALAELAQIKLNFYPDLSNRRIKRGISNWLNVKEEKISIFNGSDSGIATICRLFVESRDKVITINPTYGNYKAIASRYTQNVLGYQLDYPFKLNFTELENYISDTKPKLVFITNPNNPTGIELDPSELLNLAKKFPPICFVIDEAYGEFGNSQINLENIPPNMIVLRTFSKAWGLAGIRLGYSISHESLSKKLALSRDNKEVDVFAQIVGSIAVENPQYMLDFVKEVSKSKEIIGQFFDSHQIPHLKGSGNFILFKTHDPFKLDQTLKSSGIYIRNRTEVTNLEGYVRVTVGDLETTKDFLQALHKIDSL